MIVQLLQERWEQAFLSYMTTNFRAIRLVSCPSRIPKSRFVSRTPFSPRTRPSATPTEATHVAAIAAGAVLKTCFDGSAGMRSVLGPVSTPGFRSWDFSKTHTSFRDTVELEASTGQQGLELQLATAQLCRLKLCDFFLYLRVFKRPLLSWSFRKGSGAALTAWSVLTSDALAAVLSQY